MKTKNSPLFTASLILIAVTLHTANSLDSSTIIPPSTGPSNFINVPSDFPSSSPNAPSSSPNGPLDFPSSFPNGPSSSPNGPSDSSSDPLDPVYSATSPDYFDLISASSDDSSNDSSKIKWPSDLLRLNYAGLTKVNKDCRHSPDKCDYGAKRSRELDVDLDCLCDPTCKSFGNCCIDAAELNRTLNLNSSVFGLPASPPADETQFVERLTRFNAHKEEYDCKELTSAVSYRFLLVRSKCPADFDNRVIRDKCEQPSGGTDPSAPFPESSKTQFEINYKDPYQSTPVTSTKSRITYSNIFCALCNEHRGNLQEAYAGLAKDEPSHLRFWRMNVTCENLSISNITLPPNVSFMDFVSRNFSYEPENDSWVIEYTDKNGAQAKHSCQLKLHMPEDLQFYIKPCQPRIVSRCAPDWPTETVEQRKVAALCSAYQSRVNHPETKQEYSNVHCALCNFVDINQLGCPSNLQLQSLDELGIDQWGRSNHISSFSTLFDVNFLISNTNFVGKKVVSLCPDRETIYDPIFQRCRDLICGFQQVFFGGECRVPITYENARPTEDLVNNSRKSEAELFPVEENGRTVLLNQTESDLNELVSPPLNQSDPAAAQQFTAEFRKCAKIGLTAGNYMELKNDSIYLPQYELIVDKGNYNLTDSQLLICVPFSPLLDKFENHYSSVAYVCLVFSIICLALYLVLFCLVPDLRNLSGKNLSSLCVSLIMVYCCFAIAPFGWENDPQFCKLIAYVKYYGLLASFCWTGVIAFDIYQTIRNSLNSFRYKTGPQTARFVTYSLICWSLPAFAVVFACLTDIGQFEQSIPDEFRPNFGQTKECWFGYRKGLLVFFVLPVGVITVLNLIFFLLTSKSLLLTTNRNKLKLSDSSASKFDFNLYLRLFLLMGLTWMTGFLATYFEKIYLWYLFTLFNTLQGVFIFIAFGCKAAVMKKLKMRLSKLLLLDRFSSNKNSSVSTVTCRTPTNQSTITHLNSGDLCGDSYKVKDLLFSNKLADRSLGSLSRSLTDLYAKNFYSTESINKSHLNQMTNDYYQAPELQAEQPATTLHLHRQLPNSSSTFGTIDNRLSTIENPNRSSTSSFKYAPGDGTLPSPASHSHINSQMNKWFDF